MNRIFFIFLSLTATIALLGTEKHLDQVAQRQCDRIVNYLSWYSTEDRIDAVIKKIQKEAHSNKQPH